MSAFDPKRTWAAQVCCIASAEGLHAGEDDCARAVGLDDLTSRRQHPVRLVDAERHDRVGVLLVAVAFISVRRIEDFGYRVEAKKAGDFA